jgi:hypothetical protein
VCVCVCECMCVYVCVCVTPSTKRAWAHLRRNRGKKSFGKNAKLTMASSISSSSIDSIVIPLLGSCFSSEMGM